MVIFHLKSTQNSDNGIKYTLHYYLSCGRLKDKDSLVLHLVRAHADVS